eukprot:Nitzschia sp. Nitz4//scaffold27_size158506//76211//76906//NITZ4_002601-RA/size158506-processed-gene-0.18-mRNA-1//1//CDS//3329545491//8962//frame0
MADVVTNQDQLPHVILRGSAADLSALRESDSQSLYLEQRSPLLPQGIPCRVQLQEENSTEPSNSEGELFVTSSQLLFVTTQSSDDASDFAVGATCIHLHAMTEDPEVSVYLQLTDGDDEDTSELTVVPLDPSSCQSLFDALCKLVSLHPLDLDDEEGGDEPFGDGCVMSDDLIWAPSAGFGTVLGDDDEEEDGASPEERAAMLERLDNLLVVQPEYQVQDGQFEDAEEEER